MGGLLTAELWQFAALIGVFLVVAVLWIFVIYLPARTMEYSEAHRTESRERDGESPGRSG
jgi:hypothetical protein